jgi:hypothetical protein
MGLALDEPKEGDQTYQVNGMSVIVDPFAMTIIKDAGGLAIKSNIFGPVAELENASCGSCSC